MAQKHDLTPSHNERRRAAAPAQSSEHARQLVAQAELLQRYVGNASLARMAAPTPPKPPSGPNDTGRVNIDATAEHPFASTRSHPGSLAQSLTPASSDPFFRQPKQVAVQRRGVPSIQRTFTGPLHKMTDSAIFDAIKVKHPEVPDRVYTLIGAYRRAKSKKFASVDDLIGGMDTKVWKQESIDKQEKQDKELREQTEKTEARELKKRQKDPESHPYKIYDDDPEAFDELANQFDRDDAEEQKRFDGKAKPKTDSGIEGVVTPLAKPEFNEPEGDKPVFKAVGNTLPISFNGKHFDIKPGQSFLNTGTSALYKNSKSEIKSGEIMLGDPKRFTEEDELKPVNVTDGHHRLVWAAFFHGEPVRAVMKKQSSLAIGGGSHEWATMKYGEDPNRLPVTPPELPELKQKALREWVSPESKFRGFQRKAKKEPNLYLAFVDEICEYHHFYVVDVPTRKAIAAYIAVRAPHPLTADFDLVVSTLVARAKNKEVATNMAESFKSLSFPKFKPAIVFDPAESIGFYDTVLHVITLDPYKNAGADGMLDTLSFEIQNAVRREPMRRAQGKKDVTERAKSVAELEFGTDQSYVATLLKSWGATDINDLVVNKLKVPEKFRTKRANYKALKKANTNVPMPPRNELPAQNMRQALWFWKTDGWSDPEKQEIWALTEHAEGMESSLKTY